MLINLMERIYVNSPIHTIDQRRVVRFLKEMCELPAGSHILEIGCGRGVGMQLILEAFSPGHAEALDLDPRMVGLAERRLRGVKGVTIECRVANAEKLPQSPSSAAASPLSDVELPLLHRHTEHSRRGYAGAFDRSKAR